MPENIKSPDRIPHESITDSHSVRSWSLPSMDTGRVIKAVKKGANASKNESIDSVPKSKKPKPLTAEDMQKIAEQAKKEGYAEGYQEGKTKGHKDGLVKGERQGTDKAYKETKRQIETERMRLKTISDQLMIPAGEQELLLENIIIDTAIRLAQEIIQREISESPEALFNIVKRAVSALPAGAKNVSVTLGEQDAELFNETYPEAARSWAVHVDNTLQVGGCRVETSESLIDYSVESRLEKYLLEVRSQGEKGEELLEDINSRMRPEELADSEIESDLSEVTLPAGGVEGEGYDKEHASPEPQILPEAERVDNGNEFESVDLSSNNTIENSAPQTTSQPENTTFVEVPQNTHPPIKSTASIPQEQGEPKVAMTNSTSEALVNVEVNKNFDEDVS